MEKMAIIKSRKLVPIIGMKSTGKSKFLNTLYNIDFLGSKAGTGTKIVNILRYNPYIETPCFYHIQIFKKDNDYIFYKDPKRETIFGKEKIAKEIKNINNQLNDKSKIEYIDKFYMTEINEAPFFRDKSYLFEHDLCDIPSLSECIKDDLSDSEQKLKKEKESFGIVFNDRGDIFKKEKGISINNEIRDEDDIFYKLDMEDDISYLLTTIFNIIRNYIDGAIIILSVENYIFEDNFDIIAKLYKITQKKLKNCLIILNKIDLSKYPKKDIENFMRLIFDHFPKFKTFNINLNTFIAISTIQLQNEFLMSKDFKYLMTALFLNILTLFK